MCKHEKNATLQRIWHQLSSNRKEKRGVLGPVGLREVMPVFFWDIKRGSVQVSQISRGSVTMERRNPQEFLAHPSLLPAAGGIPQRENAARCGVWVSQPGAGGTHWAPSVPERGSVSPAPCRCPGLLLVGSTGPSRPQSSPAAPSMSWECFLLEKWH